MHDLLMRRVVIAAFPGVQTLDVHGPAEVFSTASSLSGGGAYAVEVVAADPGPVPTSSVALHPVRFRSAA
jgi:transcriptional regulator GlxA family with amidase domain